MVLVSFTQNFEVLISVMMQLDVKLIWMFARYKAPNMKKCCEEEFVHNNSLFSSASIVASLESGSDECSGIAEAN